MSSGGHIMMAGDARMGSAASEGCAVQLWKRACTHETTSDASLQRLRPDCCSNPLPRARNTTAFAGSTPGGETSPHQLIPTQEPPPTCRIFSRRSPASRRAALPIASSQSNCMLRSCCTPAQLSNSWMSTWGGGEGGVRGVCVRVCVGGGRGGLRAAAAAAAAVVVVWGKGGGGNMQYGDLGRVGVTSAWASAAEVGRWEWVHKPSRVCTRPSQAGQEPGRFRTARCAEEVPAQGRLQPPKPSRRTWKAYTHRPRGPL